MVGWVSYNGEGELGWGEGLPFELPLLKGLNEQCHVTVILEPSLSFSFQVSFFRDMAWRNEFDAHNCIERASTWYHES